LGGHSEQEYPTWLSVGAELTKLRRRRGLHWSTLALIVAPVAIGYIVLTIHHAVNPEQAAPAGGIENLRATFDFLTTVGTIAAIMVGVTAGGGDLGAGVFRELVVTGRCVSRCSASASRVERFSLSRSSSRLQC